MMQPPGCLYMACLTQIGNHIVAFSLDSGPVRRLHPGMTADAVGDGGDAGRIAKGDGQAPGPFEEGAVGLQPAGHTGAGQRAVADDDVGGGAGARQRTVVDIVPAAGGEERPGAAVSDDMGGAQIAAGGGGGGGGGGIAHGREQGAGAVEEGAVSCKQAGQTGGGQVAVADDDVGGGAGARQRTVVDIVTAAGGEERTGAAVPDEMGGAQIAAAGGGGKVLDRGELAFMAGRFRRHVADMVAGPRTRRREAALAGTDGQMWAFAGYAELGRRRRGRP